jgi:hypothetical protein
LVVAAEAEEDLQGGELSATAGVAEGKFVEVRPGGSGETAW